MIQKIIKILYLYALTLRSLDTQEVNKFIFRKFKHHLLNTKVTLTLLMSVCVISFSILSSEAVYLFIPQTTVGSYASFLLFVLVVSILTFVLYPLFIIYLINLVNGLFKSNSWLKVALKISFLAIAFAVGIDNAARSTISNADKIQIVCAWVLIYLLIINRYIAHLQHQQSHNKFAAILIVAIISLSIKPFLLITTHTLESLNVTNINPQVYLPWQNCELLKNLNTKLNITESNDILSDHNYYTELKNNSGCFIYGNVIRYSFGYDYVLLVKRNIKPLVDNKGISYNTYVRLNCYAGNCYSDNNLQYDANNDIFANLIKNGEKLDHTF